MAPPRDTAAPARPRLLSRAYWVMMALCAMSLVAGAGVALFGPRLFARPSAPASPTATAQHALGAGDKGR